MEVFNFTENTFVLNKKELRKHIIAERLALPLSFTLEAAHSICQRILNLPRVQQAQNIALYLAHRGEIDTRLLLGKLWDLHKTCLLPILQNEKKLKFIPYAANDPLVRNKFGILEPTAEKAVAIENIDIIIMPLVAFDIKGHRIGSGAGYYDRTLAFIRNQPQNKNPYLIGLSYELQKIPEINAEPWDIPLNLIITENSSYEILANEIRT